MLVLLPFLIAFGTAAADVDLQILPAQATLTGPRAEQRFLVVAARPNQGSVADLTADAILVSSNPAIAVVDNAGVVRPASDGEALITARLRDGRSVSASVRVERTSERFVWSFRNHVLPVMTKAGCNSGPCHGAASGQNYFKLTLRGYAPEVDYRALTSQAGARRVLTLAPAHSLMLLKPTLAVAHGGGKRFTTASPEYRVLVEWIAAGAPAPRADDPSLTALDVLPSRAKLRPGDRHRILVRASFSDGHVEDVTRWTKYSSTDMGVLQVNEEGEVKIESPGEAAVAISYLNRVALARFTIPFPERVDPAIYRALPRHNFIDDLVWKKLEDLGIRPSPPANDAKFLRRAYLDAAGILPSADEAQSFVADATLDKRTRLVEKLLLRSEFVDYWTYKWCDMLLVSSTNIPVIAARSYYDWIRSSVSANKPWDRFVREIFTASGSNFENGATNYYVQHEDPTAIAENASLTFLGISVNCARCHNHPLDKWTQDDYYGLASFFSRLGRKSEARPGETIVFVSGSGEIVHPRLGKVVTARPLGGEPVPPGASMDRRDQFVEWLVSPRNRYFVRSIVNRIWHNFMGKGLVDPIDEMRETNPASNQELLDALAEHFIRQEFDVKELIRTIMNSAVYQVDSQPYGGNDRDDKYWSHSLVRRLPAEVILDAICQVTGIPEQFEGYPPGTRALQLADTQVDSYFLTTFGRPKRETNSHAERLRDPSISQALQLINGSVLNEKLHRPGGIIDSLMNAGISDAEIITEIYWTALGRPPNPNELARVGEELAKARKDVESAGIGFEKSRRTALTDFCAGILMSNEFLFNH